VTITSLAFAAFVIGALAAYFLVPGKAQNLILLAASYFFCGLLGWEFLVVLLLVTLAGYLASFGVITGRRGRKLWLTLGILIQLGALAFFKYSDYFLPKALKLLRLLHLPSPDIALTLLLPVGLSFYTLQAIAYLVDIYQGKSQPAASPLDFALYMAYFPRFVAGPIERAGPFMDQLHRARRVDNARVARGLTLIIIGLVRKTLVADVLRPLTNFQVFRTPSDFSGPQLIATLIAFAIYVYNDFAGYTSLVRGVSALFGIELISNFNLPFFSRSFTELWTRWHISLSTWLRDYIYYPLSRAFLRRDPSSRGPATILIPPLITLIASGLWHGASWHMLVWGAINGLFMAGERVITLARPSLPPDRQPRWRQWLGRGVVLFLVLLALVPFQSSLPHALEYWRGILLWTSTALPDARLLVPIALGGAVDWIQFLGREELPFLKWPGWLQGLLLALVLLALFLITRVGAQGPFVYQEF
jgi:D-alanyl-lipoteichoic acid acyltransferase DltB (MBOAT superfamily)